MRRSWLSNGTCSQCYRKDIGWGWRSALAHELFSFYVFARCLLLAPSRATVVLVYDCHMKLTPAHAAGGGIQTRYGHDGRGDGGYLTDFEITNVWSLSFGRRSSPKVPISRILGELLTSTWSGLNSWLFLLCSTHLIAWTSRPRVKTRGLRSMSIVKKPIIHS